MDMVKCAKFKWRNKLALNLFIAGLPTFSIFVLFSLSKVSEENLSLQMAISRNKLILLLGMVCLEQGESAALSLHKGKFQMNSITALAW
jgi:hypothetical protein